MLKDALKGVGLAFLAVYLMTVAFALTGFWYYPSPQAVVLDAFVLFPIFSLVTGSVFWIPAGIILGVLIPRFMSGRSRWRGIWIGAALGCATGVLISLGVALWTRGLTVFGGPLFVGLYVTLWGALYGCRGAGKRHNG